MPAKVDAFERKIEALLFASGTPLSVKELTEQSAANDFHAVQRALRRLVRAYRGRQTALEIRRVGDRYALQLREEYLAAVHSVQPIEIPPRSLKALTLIAYHQPMLQSFLVKMVGEGAYEEVQQLRDLGLVRTEPKGSTLELSTTARFAEYFGIGSSRPEEIRIFLARKLGLPPADGVPGGPAPATEEEDASRPAPSGPEPPGVSPG